MIHTASSSALHRNPVHGCTIILALGNILARQVVEPKVLPQSAATIKLEYRPNRAKEVVLICCGGGGGGVEPIQVGNTGRQCCCTAPGVHRYRLRYLLRWTEG